MTWKNGITLALGVVTFFLGLLGTQTKFGFSSPVVQPYIITSSTSTQSATTTQFFGNVGPQIANLYDLGNPYAWKDVYASGTVYAVNVTVSGTCTGCSAAVTSTTFFPGLQWTNATGTNTTSTNLYATHFGFVDASGTFINLASTGNITTNNANSLATITLSGGSGAITATPPIPTSTTLISGSFPQFAYSFDATNTQCIYWGPVFIRDSWDGSTMTPTLQWQSASGTGNSIWALRAESVASGTYSGATFTGAKSYATGTTILGFHAVNTSMSTLTVGSASAGTSMKFELCREGGHGQDTMGGVAYPNSVKIEYGLSKYSD